MMNVRSGHPELPSTVSNHLVTNTIGAVALKLTCPTDPGTNTVVRATKAMAPKKGVTHRRA
jgi:hypothetical protein